MSNVVFSENAWAEYTYLQQLDKKTLKKVNELIKDIVRNGEMSGAGKPEKLKYSENYSRRIDEKNRLVYSISESGDVIVKSCLGHYED